MVFMAPTARPTNDYEALDNEKRNMYEPVAFFNGSAGPVNVVYAGTPYGTVEAGATVSLPKFVAEWLIGRNLLYKIVSGGDPEAIEAIEKNKTEIAGAELVQSAQAQERIKNAKEARAEHGKKLKDAGEAIETELEPVEEEVDEPEATDDEVHVDTPHKKK